MKTANTAYPDIARELARFARHAETKFDGFLAERPDEHALILRPAAGDGYALPAGKDVALTLMGLTHGNEWAGAGILNDVLAHIAAGGLKPRIPMAFVLGNPWAATENKRFLERDLNRSFARESTATREERRAKQLAAILDRTAYFIDYHQTTRRSVRPFFIFPYTKASFGFARSAAPRPAIVTHWGAPFSVEGMCTDEYVNSRGGIGLSIEVGQNGLDPYQIAVGVDVAVGAIATVTAALAPEMASLPAVDRIPARDAVSTSEIYTWAEVMPWPQGQYVKLEEGWENFAPVRGGERLGEVDGREIRAPTDGYMLFPKYLTLEQQRALTTPPAELCRIMRRIEVKELPAGEG